MRQKGQVGIGGVGLAAIAAVVLLSSGCGYGGVATASSGDAQNGQALFGQKCGACHTLQAAGTSGTIGPNLDNSFAGSIVQGYEQSTIENLVLEQIRLGSGPLSTYDTGEEFTSKKCLDPSTRQTCYDTPMPANIVTGKDALDVAAYVASIAGKGGYTVAGPIGTSGDAIFKGAGCAGCHTLAAAGSTGTIGPNLDDRVPGMSLADIVKQVTNGGGGMPPFQGKLTDAQIQAVAQYVLSSAGK
ncbi:MAG: quinohemoprotein ethanol dehydrogenase [Gaiellaceae bacterium]|nr:quinohemoprotein ethanol dehydrogenase [Gaiellaceae bacterium]